MLCDAGVVGRSSRGVSSTPTAQDAIVRPHCISLLDSELVNTERQQGASSISL